jgi:hypothetical protein
MIETGYGHHAYITSEVGQAGRVTLLYGHMTHVTVEEGQTVQPGDAIGTAGSTGASKGPHLHLSFKIEGLKLPANGDHLNARPYLDPIPPPRGQPRTPYARTYVLLPPGADAAWARAVVDAGWNTQRFTIGGSADDAGIGDLDKRVVLAVNPSGWPSDLADFFAEHYPGVTYHAVEADTPWALRGKLIGMPTPKPVPASSVPNRGQPRAQYKRTYVLLPPGAGREWAAAVVDATWDKYRYTVGSSADDAGIGDLDERGLVAVNPSGWPSNLRSFFERYYPGVTYSAVEADTAAVLRSRIAA